MERKRIRRCDDRCHHARGSKCKCICQGFFHGSAGAVNRAALVGGAEELLQQHGFKKGETVYIEQKEMPLEVEGA